MKTIMLLFVLTLCSCGKVTYQTPGGGTLTINSDPIPTAVADVASCPADMTLIQPAVGHGAFCVENSVNAADTHPSATVTCGNKGREVCSFAELNAGNAQGIVTSIAMVSGSYPYSYWARNVSGQQVGFWNAQGDVSVGTSSNPPSYPYYCCSR